MGRARSESVVQWVERKDGLRPMMRFTFQKRQVTEWLHYSDTPAQRKAAEAYGKDIVEQARRGTLDYAREFPNSPNLVLFAGDVPSVEKAFKQFLRDYEEGEIKIPGVLKRKPAPGTLYNHRRHLLMWQELIGKDRPITQVTYLVIQTAIRARSWTDKESHFNNCMDSLRMAIKYWRKQYPSLPDVYDEDACPATQKRASESDDDEVDPFSAEERNAILADLFEHYDERVGLYFQFQFYTGARPNESVAVLWTATELGGTPPTVRIRRSRTYHGTREGRAKTKKSIRRVELSAKARAAVERMRKYTSMKPHGHVFEDPRTGEPWKSGEAPRRIYWNPMMKRLKLAHRTPYVCRHTWATLAIMTGTASQKWISEQMGTSLQELDRTYAFWLHKADKGRQIEQLDQHPNFGGT